MPEDFEDVRPDLLPIVRSRSHFELNQLRSVVESGTPISWPYVPLGEHFGVALVYDLPDAMRSIPQANLDAWGLTLYEALEIARENLSTLPAKFIGPQSGDGVYLSATGDNYDASRILSPELIEQFQVQRRSGGHDRQSRQPDCRRRGRRRRAGCDVEDGGGGPAATPAHFVGRRAV